MSAAREVPWRDEEPWWTEARPWLTGPACEFQPKECEHEEAHPCVAPKPSVRCAMCHRLLAREPPPAPPAPLPLRAREIVFNGKAFPVQAAPAALRGAALRAARSVPTDKRMG
jgi:hypothetical protein